MKGFFRWFKNSARTKRWMLMSLVGLIAICYGISYILTHKTLNKEGAVIVAVSFVIGFVMVVIGMVNIQKRMLEILVEESDTRDEKNNVNSLIFNKKVYNQGPKIVVIGGGAGLNTVLRGLKNYTDNITAIVTVSDYGEEPSDAKKALKILPLDDIKDSIIALSQNEDEMSRLLNCQFDSGSLKSLSFSDLYFLSMNKIYDNFTKSVETSGKVLNMTGRVLPVTLDPITVCAELIDGSVIKGRDRIPEVVSDISSQIARVYIDPTNTLPAPGVIEAIEEADAIIIGPGSLYTNVIPNLLVRGIAKAIKESNAMKVYVSNIMTEMGQTDEYTLSDHIKTIIDYVGEKVIDYCIYDTGEVVPEFIQMYNQKGADIVLPDIQKVKDLGVNLIQRNLSTIDGDKIIHNPDIIAEAIIQLVCDELVFEDMQNDSQFMMLNAKLKETKRERRKRERKDRKFQKSGREKFERKDPSEESKFKTKYKERINSIKESSDKETIEKRKK